MRNYKKTDSFFMRGKTRARYEKQRKRALQFTLRFYILSFIKKQGKKSA